MGIGKRRGKVVKGAGNPGSSGSDSIGGSLSKNDHWYLQEGFGFSGSPGQIITPTLGHTASGGIISDYSDPTGQLYRCHIFLQSGTFTVTTVGDVALSPTKPNASVEVLAVAGGGAGGITAATGYGAGGGGAGGVVTNMTGHPRENATNATVTATSYPITVGAGGAPPSGADQDAQSFSDGTPSTSPLWPISAAGGGAGGQGSPDSGGQYRAGRAGGSGGGGNPGAAGAGNTPPVTPVQGYAGGVEGGPVYRGGGGGGAGEVGRNGTTTANPRPGFGGNGIQVAIAGPATNSPIGTPGNTPNGTSPTDTGYFGGGGGGATEYDPTPALGGTGGGASGDIDSSSPDWNSGIGPREGQSNTGGGGGGKCVGPSPTGAYPFGELGKSSGGSGIYAIRYKIDATQTKTAKCTGGSICFSPTKTIHAFTTSGTFTAPGSFSETCEYVVIGGGGGGGDTKSWSSHGAGGGGAGAYVADTTPLSGPFAKAITIGQGGTKGTQDNWGGEGGQSSIQGTVSAKGGGGGGGSGNATSDPTHMNGRPSANPYGGSGGGSAYTGNPGSSGTYGYDGGDQSPPGGGAGGGGAGGAGGANPGTPTSDPDKRVGGLGGIGVQLPATFRTNVPSVYGMPGPGGGAGWVAGGGGGGNGGPTSGGANVLMGGGGGGAPPADLATPWAGGGNGDTVTDPGAPTKSPLVNGRSNTGGGGGGGMGTASPTYPWAESFNGNGGSGLVLIAYPT